MSDDNESAIKFPCDFTIKVMGRATTEFEECVLRIIKKRFSEITTDDLQRRYSKDSNYCSLSITLHPQDKATIDGLYCELSAHPLILFVL